MAAKSALSFETLRETANQAQFLCSEAEHVAKWPEFESSWTLHSFERDQSSIPHRILL